MQKQLTWTFSSQISHEELAGCFRSRQLPLSASAASEILAKDLFTQDLLTPADLQKAREYLCHHFPDVSDELIDELTSILSQTDAKTFLLNTYHGANWPLPEFEHLNDLFNRYVSLLSLVLESGQTPMAGWPHGRLHLIDFDGNVGAKALAGVEHGGNPFIREETVDPMKARSFLNDVVDFGAMLTGFADRLDDPIWDSWLTVVNATRQSSHEFLLRRRFDSHVSDILTTYFDRRELKVHDQTPTALSDAIPNASAFWTCLNSSVDASIPAVARELSLPGQRLAGLTFGAVAKDPFASLFVRTDGQHRPLVECDFETWKFALRLTKKELDTAFGEVDDLRMRGFLPFFFNT